MSLKFSLLSHKYNVWKLYKKQSDIVSVQNILIKNWQNNVFVTEVQKLKFLKFGNNVRFIDTAFKTSSFFGFPKTKLHFVLCSHLVNV